jgi:hypothetical protein
VNFLLGVGAQRCGTTWIHHYLAQHPSVFVSPYKELHVFDVMFAPEASGLTREKRFERLRLLVERVLRGEPVDRGALAIALERYRLSLGTAAYLGYFRSYVRPEHRVMGEITPSYSLVPASGWRFVREFLLGEKLAPRVLFVMRDPVERMYSQLRLNQHMGMAQVRDAYASALETPGVVLRTRYDLTLAALEAEFRPEELLLLFYEELFRPRAVEDLCRFLGIEARPADFSARLNTAPDVGAIDPAFRRAARERLAPVYDFCAARFGRERLRALWPCY